MAILSTSTDMRRLIDLGAWSQGSECHAQGPVEVVLSRIKNPSKSPFTKGDFQFPPLEKGDEGGFLGNQHLQKSIHYGETDFDVAVMLRRAF
jgi:hypothetical protein